MKIIISNASSINFASKVDLNNLIPEGVDGNALSYDQDGGQVLIGESLWGIYRSSENSYVLQYEEGLMDFLSLLALTSRVIDKLKREFSQDLVFKIQGLKQ